MPAEKAGAVVAILFAFAAAAEGGDTRARVAVVEFKSSGRAQWLGPAVSASLRNRLRFAKGATVLSREDSTKVKGDPGALGAGYLVSGSAELRGTGEAAAVTISVRVTGSGGLRLQGRGALYVRDRAEQGRIADVASIEYRLAVHVAAAVGISTADQGLKENEAENIEARRSLGEGLIALRRAEEQLGGKKGGSLTPRRRAEVEGLLERAERKLREAQERNGATFYASAHRNEGRARELLAAIQKTEDDARVVRDKTVRLFRKDASKSPAALFDLAQALQLGEQYEQAIAVYKECASLAEGEDGGVVWDIGSRPSNWCVIPDLLGNDVPYSTNFGLYYATDSLVVVPGETDIIALGVTDGRERWRAELGQKLTWPYIIGTDDYIVVVGDETLWILGGEDGRVLYSRDELGLPPNTYGGPYAQTLVFLPKGKTPEYMVVYRESLPSKQAEEVESAMVSLDVANDRELWRESWRRPFGSAFFEKVPKERLRSGNIFARVSEKILYPQMVEGTIFRARYTGGGFSYECVDAKTGGDASERFHERIRELKRTGYIFSDGHGGGWYVAKSREAPKTEMFLRIDGWRSAPSPVERNVSRVYTLAPLWSLFRSKLVDKRGSRYARYGTGNPVVLYDGLAEAFRPIAWPSKHYDDLMNEHSMQVYGDKLLVVEQSNKEFRLIRHAPAAELVWRYRVERQFGGSPLLRGNIVVVPEWEGKRSRDFRLFAVRPPSKRIPIKTVDIWRNVALSCRAIGDTAGQEEALRRAIDADAGDMSVFEELIRLRIEQGRAYAALCEFWRLPKRRREEGPKVVRHTLMKATGTICGVPDNHNSMNDFRILPDRRQVVGAERQCFVIRDLDHPERSWLYPWDQRKKNYYVTAGVIARDNSHVTVCMEFKDKDKVKNDWIPRGETELRRYDLEAREYKAIKLPSMQWVTMRPWLWCEGLKRDYDAGPQLFIDRESPDRLLLVDPHKLEIVGRTTLPEPCRTAEGAGDVYRESPVIAALYKDRYVLCYVPKSPEQTHHRIVCIREKDRKLMWTTTLPMSGLSAEKHRKGGWAGFDLLPGGNSVWFYEYGRRTRRVSLDIDDGSEKGNAPVHAVAWYASQLTPREDFHDPSKFLEVPEYDWRGLEWCNSGGPMWEGGPAIVLDRAAKQPVILYPEGPVRVEGVDIRWIVTTGPYVAMETRSHGDYLFVGGQLARAMGYAGEVPAEALVEHPLIFERVDESWGFWLKIWEEYKKRGITY